MSTKTQIAILEWAERAFNWGWMIAGGFSLYYLIMVVGFDESGKYLYMAFVYCLLSKWAHKFFGDIKRRVAFEAKMIEQGMTPEEANLAWLEEYTR